MQPLRILFCGSNLAGSRVLSDLLSAPESFTITEVWVSPEPVENVDPGASVLSVAERHRMPVFTGNPRKGIDPATMGPRRFDLALCVNYRYILSPEIYKAARLGSINVHGSLLPAYRGRSPNVWAIINGETETGVTVHVIDEGVDTGPILSQERVAIMLDDTGHTLSMKLTALYPRLVRKAIRNLQDKDFTPIPQDESKASVFPKRTPDDGRINWNWEAKRVYDWIRAQTAPYPGAFAYLGGNKMMVWEGEWVQRTADLGITPRRPGQLIGLAHGFGDSPGGVFVACGDGGVVRLMWVQRFGEDKNKRSSYDLVSQGAMRLGEVLT